MGKKAKSNSQADKMRALQAKASKAKQDQAKADVRCAVAEAKLATLQKTIDEWRHGAANLDQVAALTLQKNNALDRCKKRDWEAITAERHRDEAKSKLRKAQDEVVALVDKLAEASAELDAQRAALVAAKALGMQTHEELKEEFGIERQCYLDLLKACTVALLACIGDEVKPADTLEELPAQAILQVGLQRTLLDAAYKHNAELQEQVDQFSIADEDLPREVQEARKQVKRSRAAVQKAKEDAAAQKRQKADAVAEVFNLKSKYEPSPINGRC